MPEHELRKDLNVIVTHVDDSTRGREGLYVYLWGKYVKSNNWIPIDECIENIKNILEQRPHPPFHQKLQVGQICCVHINQKWHRACVKQLELDPDQNLKVQLVDSGASYCAPLSSLRTLEDIPGKVAEHIREREPVAFKFVLADVVAPIELMDTNCQWSEKAISFLKSDVLNHNWKANLVGNYGDCQVLRLFYPLQHHLLATTMIRQGFGIPNQIYQEAISTQRIDHTSASQRPAHNSAYLRNVPNENNLPPQINSVYPGFSLASHLWSCIPPLDPNLASVHSNLLTTNPTIAHCSAKHTATNSSAEEGANQTKSNKKDCSSTAVVTQEVIRAPRESPPSSEKEEAKDPMGCFRQTPASVKNPHMTKRFVAAPVPKADVPILAVAAIPVQRRSNDPPLQMSRPILQPDHKKKECSLPSNSPKLVYQPTDLAILNPIQQVESFSRKQTETSRSIENVQKRPANTSIEVIISSFTKNFRFHIRYCSYEAQLKQMMKEIQILGPQAELVDTLKNNLICLYRSNGNWCRIRIVNTAKRDGILCQSLDCGKFFCVPINYQKKDFRIMKESLKRIPSFAICVELAGVNVEHEKEKVDKHPLIGRKYLMDIVREGNVKLVKLKSFDVEDLPLNKLSESGFSSPRSRR